MIKPSIHGALAFLKSRVQAIKLRIPIRLNNRASEYAKRLQNEKAFYKDCTNVHDLPAIFHYWSNKYLATGLSDFGFTNPDDFFTHFIKTVLSSRKNQKTRLLSIGSGNCDLEIKISRQLIDSGMRNFTFECLDINEDMLSRGRTAAREHNLTSHLLFSSGDFNEWSPKNSYEIILANQSLHHVLNLEGLFDSVKQALDEEGLFLVSDMIGRNGHMRWPEAMKELGPFWNEMPKEYRNNRLLNRYEDQYINHDCSSEGFEGIRAQDILPLLVQRFNFRFFYPFGNIIFVFIDRPFGHNFKADEVWDRDFIDRIHSHDEECIISGDLKPTSMLAVLTNKQLDTIVRHPALTPSHCVRLPD